MQITHEQYISHDITWVVCLFENPLLQIQPPKLFRLVPKCGETVNESDYNSSKQHKAETGTLVFPCTVFVECTYFNNLQNALLASYACSFHWRLTDKQIVIQSPHIQLFAVKSNNNLDRHADDNWRQSALWSEVVEVLMTTVTNICVKLAETSVASFSLFLLCVDWG